MIIALYLLARLLVFVLVGAMIAVAATVMLLWFVLMLVLDFLTEPATWSRKYRRSLPRYQPPPSGGHVPRNPRMYWSGRR